MEIINVGLVGTRFMGRAHSNAYKDVATYFELPANPVMKVACGLEEGGYLKSFASKFGWQETETDWQKVIGRSDINLVDICTSNASHEPIAVAAAKAGKHILCEKPIARNALEAKRMMEAARDAGVVNMVAFNYRRVPALALAKNMIAEGRIGRVFHFNAVYYQDWLVDPNFPYVWRNDVKESGSGAHGDMNAHIVDLARFLVGDVEAVNGTKEIFVKQRKTPDGQMLDVTADDAMYFLAKFECGALGAFLCSRFATGRKNYLRLEIFGSEGSLAFNLERLNELDFFDRSAAIPEQGFRNILVTENIHPYVNAWWPPGHIIGWEHTFIHEVADLLHAIPSKQKVHPDFYDGYRCQLVLDGVSKSAETGQWVEIKEQ
jgi:predicted dehydrogenase